ncbi:MAG: BrnA antitoxin family protein, partial [Oceanicaulis sp.]|nr:BrnA antitoxin family protein [Oceanicaulis sp.]
TGHGKQQVTVRLDRDVLAFFKKGGRGDKDVFSVAEALGVEL